jgi:RimJ/RimL family protein N-acetyltransferase
MNVCRNDIPHANDAEDAEDRQGPARAGIDYPQHLIEDHRLPDGTRVRLRPISPRDRRRHWRFLCSLSLQTRYQRLFSPRGLLPGELRRMVEIDYQREMALVAVVETAGDEQVLGVARYVREETGDLRAALADCAEFAIVVADAWQRRGIGTLLLQRLRQVAEAAGVRHFAGLTLATNLQMIRLARRLGFALSREPDDWTVRRVTWRQTADDESAGAPDGIGSATATRPNSAQ